MRHVLVTGGSRGIGLALVIQLIDAGYRVTTCSRTRGAAIAKLQLATDRLRWLPFRLGEDKAERLLRDAVASVDRDAFWGVINNAATAGAGVLATYPSSALRRIVDVNLTGTLDVTRAAVRELLVADQGGRIINISSVVALRGHSGLSAYSATKAAVDGMTRALARELGRRRITVNSVAPGYVATSLSESIDGGQLKQIVRRTPLGRVGCASDVGSLVAFLLSDDAAFITGQTIAVDGGLTC